MMAERIRVLLLEDVDADAELVLAELRQGGLVVDARRVVDEAGFLAALDEYAPDVVLADYRLPGYDGMHALAVSRTRYPELPFIFVSGALGEEKAVAALKAGATDYVLKDRPARLPVAVQRALAEGNTAHDRLRIAAELEAERQLTRAVLDTARAIIAVLDGEGRILHLNPAAQQALGRPRDDVLGAPFWEAFVTADVGEGARQRLRDALDWGNYPPQRPWRASTSPGRRILWSIGVLGLPGPRGERLVLCGLDVTDQEEAEQRAYFLAHFDRVTGLPNRQMFLQRLAQHCQDLPEPALLAVMMIGLARLQELRDNWGEGAADQVLLQTAHRLRAWQPLDDLLSRASDGTLAVAIAVGEESELSVLVPYILDQLRQPIEIEGRQWFLPVYGGIALYPRDATDLAMLLQAAEAALRRAEGDDVRGYAFYTPLLSDEARERLQLESELRQALQRDNELMLYYQPQVELKTGRVVGVEALLRWNHPRLGVLTPARFLAMAEVCGMMTQIGRWALREACRQMQTWLRNGAAPQTLSVNLSASQFADANLLAQIESALQGFGIRPEQLELELTESASMRDPQATIAIMQSLSRMGVRLAIDDFGTGYSNLNYLKRFPVDRLKLDQAFVREIIADPDDLAIARAVIAMAHQLRLEVVAEGVESEGQLALLSQAGCEVVQGYLYSKPVPPDECAVAFAQGYPPAEPRRRARRTLLLLSDDATLTERVRQALFGRDCELLPVTRPRDAYELLALYEIAAVLADPHTLSTDGVPFLQRVRDLHPLCAVIALQDVGDASSRDGCVQSLPSNWGEATLRRAVDDAFACAERLRGSSH